MNHSGTIDYREILLPTALVLLFFLASIYLPLVGIVIGIFTPLPIIFVYLQRGWVNAVAVLGITFLILLGTSGGLFALLYCTQYGILGIAMAETIQRRFPGERVVLISALLAALSWFFAIQVVFSGQEMNFTDFMKEKVELAIREATLAYKNSGVSEEQIQPLEARSGDVTRLFITMLPAWFMAAAAISAFLNYAVLKRFWNRLVKEDRSYFQEPPFSEWMLSDYFVWVLIGSGVSLFLPMESARVAGTNLLFLSFLVYTVHGSAIVLYWLEKKTKAYFLRYLVVAMVLLQPVFLLLITGLGIFDIWLDFRKIRAAGPPVESS